MTTLVIVTVSTHAGWPDSRLILWSKQKLGSTGWLKIQFTLLSVRKELSKLENRYKLLNQHIEDS